METQYPWFLSHQLEGAFPPHRLCCSGVTADQTLPQAETSQGLKATEELLS